MDSNLLVAPVILETTKSNISQLISKAILFVVDHISEEITLKELAKISGMSHFTFCRRFRQECGSPPIRWLWNLRCMMAREIIMLNFQISFTDIAFACGFSSCAHFSRAFRKMYDETPSQLRHQIKTISKHQKEDSVVYDIHQPESKLLVKKVALKAAIPTL